MLGLGHGCCFELSDIKRGGFVVRVIVVDGCLVFSMSMESETSAEFASDLYSHLDSSGGDYNDIRAELEDCDGRDAAVVLMREKVDRADEYMSEVFDLLDGVVLEEIEFEDGHARFDGDVGGEIDKIVDLMEGAEEAMAEAVAASRNVVDRAVSDEFKFGAHTDPESAFRYLYGDAMRMAELAREMDRRH